MGRYIDAVPQYFDGAGNPLVNGKLTFYKAGTTSLLKTYADAESTTLNTNPVKLDAAGRTPDIYFDGAARVVLTSDNIETCEYGKQWFDRSPVFSTSGDDGEDPALSLTLSYVFDTVADMTSSTTLFPAGKPLETKGYYDVGGSGAAKYLVKTEAQALSEGDVLDGYGNLQLANGNWAILQSTKGSASILQYGLVPDGTKGAATGTNNGPRFSAMVNNLTITTITGSDGVFFFGDLAPEEVLATRITNALRIDWVGAYLVVNGDQTVSNTGSAFFMLEDVNGSMVNYTFEDVGFAIGVSVGRGVLPISIYNNNSSTSGYEVGNCHVVSGQSILTCSSSTPFASRASGIRLTGSCTADDVYYGVNLAANGDNVEGAYSVKKVVRLAFIYSVKNPTLKGHAYLSLPSSGSINISNRPNAPETENLKLDMSFDVMDGLCSFNTISSIPADDGKGTIRGVDLNLYVKSVGANMPLNTPLVNFKVFDSTGGTMSTATATMDDIKLKINCQPVFTNPITQLTASDNFGVLTIKSGSQNPIHTVLESFNTTEDGHVIKGTVTGDTTVNTLDLPIFLTGQQVLKRMRLEVTAQESTAFFGFKAAIAVYDLMGFVSGGTLNLVTATEVSKTISGAATPVFTVTAVTGVKGESIRVAVSGFASNAGGEISGRLWSVI